MDCNIDHGKEYDHEWLSLYLHYYVLFFLVLAYCEPEISNGFLWPRTVEDSVSALPCNLASSSFRRETRALRPCMSGGLWGQSDLTTCTLRTDVEPFLLVWFVIENSGSGGGISMNPTGFSADGIPDKATRRMLETEVHM